MNTIFLLRQLFRCYAKQTGRQSVYNNNNKVKDCVYITALTFHCREPLYFICLIL